MCDAKGSRYVYNTALYGAPRHNQQRANGLLDFVRRTI